MKFAIRNRSPTIKIVLDSFKVSIFACNANLSKKIESVKNRNDIITKKI